VKLEEVEKDLVAVEREEESQNCHDETKNIPKNYIKAIFTFILENEEYMESLMAKLCRDSGSTGEAVSELARFI
jgi:hypothetical protein